MFIQLTKTKRDAAGGEMCLINIRHISRVTAARGECGGANAVLTMADGNDYDVWVQETVLEVTALIEALHTRNGDTQ